MIGKAVSWTVLIYAALLMMLGYLGYHRTGSMISLYMGMGFGFLLVLCSLAMFAKNKLGAYLAVILTLCLTVIFAIRYTIVQKPVPAIMAVISGGMLLFLLAQVAKWKKT
jgi:uncharacterized membrane protein (UPF0136 family)